MRFGLVGTGYWARVTHARGLAAAPGVELTAVWGRDRSRTARLAQEVGAVACATLDELTAQVDAVSFAVPPEVQAGLAVRAAEAGCHLLLEKPIATDAGDAARLCGAVDRSGVASVVFFTARFDPSTRAWLDALGDGYEGGWAQWIVSAMSDPSSPYASSSWRRDRGALWDVGPHALSLLLPTLGPVTSVFAHGGARDLVNLVFAHGNGSTSTATLTLQAPRGVSRVSLSLWGSAGVTTAPPLERAAPELLAVAAGELIGAAAMATPSHPCDVHLGEEIVRVLATADEQLRLG